MSVTPLLVAFNAALALGFGCLNALKVCIGQALGWFGCWQAWHGAGIAAMS
jgi:hypothetical protein